MAVTVDDTDDFATQSAGVQGAGHDAQVPTIGLGSVAVIKNGAFISAEQ